MLMEAHLSGRSVGSGGGELHGRGAIGEIQDDWMRTPVIG